MATSKPPWSQYEGVAAMFKIGNSKELPAIPEHLSDEGKDFVRKCLQREPRYRPTAALLLEHPFVKDAAPLDKPNIFPASSDPPYATTNGINPLGIGAARTFPTSESERLGIHSSRVSKSNFRCSDIHIPRNISCPVSPIGSPLLHPRSPQHINGRISPSPLSSPLTTSGSSTPISGGIGDIPFHHVNQSTYLQEAATVPNSPYRNGPSYWDPDVLRGMSSGSHAFQELASFDNDALGKQFGRFAKEEPCNGQSALANRVSQQLLRDHVKLISSVDLSPSPPLLGRTGGA